MEISLSIENAWGAGEVKRKGGMERKQQQQQQQTRNRDLFRWNSQGKPPSGR
jgi:hypothetical protein